MIVAWLQRNRWLHSLSPTKPNCGGVQDDHWAVISGLCVDHPHYGYPVEFGGSLFDPIPRTAAGYDWVPRSARHC